MAHFSFQGDILRSVMLFLFFLLIPSSASLTCFSSSKKTSVVASSNEVCGVEINAYNLKCLEPLIVALHDVETVFSTTIRNGTVGCRMEGHYVKCRCSTDDCNKKWEHSWSSSFNRQNVKNNKIFDCVTSKCKDENCKAFGIRGVKAFNYYDMPMTNTAFPEHKKPKTFTIMENALLWVISGSLLISWLLAIVVSFTFGGGLRPNKGRNASVSPEEELSPVAGTSTPESAVAASGPRVMTSQKSAGPSQGEPTTKSKK